MQRSDWGEALNFIPSDPERPHCPRSERSLRRRTSSQLLKLRPPTSHLPPPSHCTHLKEGSRGGLCRYTFTFGVANNLIALEGDGEVVVVVVERRPGVELCALIRAAGCLHFQT